MIPSCYPPYVSVGLPILPPHCATLRPRYPSDLSGCFFFKSLLLDFHTVRFSGTSGCFLFLYWLLSFLWLGQETKQVYVYLHLAGKSQIVSIFKSLSSLLISISKDKLIPLLLVQQRRHLINGDFPYKINVFYKR